MNWHMIISVLTIVVLKIVGMTLFLLYFPQIFGGSEDSLLPTEIYGRVSPTFGSSDVSSVPTESSRTACSRTWYFLQRRCFWLSPFELSWNKSRDFCKREASTLAIVDTPEKLKFLQDKTGAEKYFIGLYQQEKNRWHWIDNSVFNGNITNQHQNFNCVTIGLTNTYDAAPCDVNFRWICEKEAK
ncbi:C-type lectin domain family 5 member A isoform X3 [Canis lupus baileyi]|nr:C-type lectin domain family 5 member A isoform X4 [Canis lupus dingo]XP_038415296.1 C-type lectin domain family 5 member A isoform X3 [Canis lupus familiaris]XP_038544995.1 C-type lectin domain family 5 member A isoform X3 [Canis lupus familiaris]XP_851464.3 C-type lectin domain family 5 member A isoform X3 [Canis lupus familiaris]|eukprot:XP_851464.3 C-type lectin domain family 5 member A isoform X3 [Canis lupus familiaris]